MCRAMCMSLCSLLFLLLDTGCSPDDSQRAGGSLWARQEAEAESQDLAVSFGEVFAKEPVSREIRLINRGRASLSLDSMVSESGSRVLFGGVPNAEHPFAIELPAGAIVEPGAEVPATVRFSLALAPAAPGNATEYSAVVRLVASGALAGEDSVRLTLRANLVPCPKMLPASLDFGPVLVGREKVLSLLFFNPAPRPVELRSPFSWGDPSPQFAISSPLPMTVPAEGSLELEVAFGPDGVGSFQAEAPLQVGDWCPEARIALEGVGVDKLVQWAPSQLDCGFVPVGKSATATITFSTVASEPVWLSWPHLLAEDGAAAGDFALSAEEWAEGFEINPAQTVTKTVICSPSTLGPRRARLAFGLSLADQPFGTVQISASGGGPEIAVEPQSLSFGRIAIVDGVGLSTRRRLEISNTGQAAEGEVRATALRLGTERPDGSYGPPYYRVEAEPPTLADELQVELPNGFPDSNSILRGFSINFDVRFSPRSPGAKSATLVLLSNDRQQPETRVPLSGEAIDMAACDYRALNPALEFGIVHATSPRARSLVLENVGRADCLFSNPRIEGSEDFSLEGPFDSKLVAPGQKLRIPIRFAPKIPPGDLLIQLAARLELDVSSPAAPALSADLHGAVGPACFAFHPAREDFGVLRPGEASDEVLPALVNACLEDLTVTSIALDAPEGGFRLRLLEPIPAGGLNVLTHSFDNTEHTTRLFEVGFAPTELERFEASIIVDLLRAGQPLRYLLPLRGRVDQSQAREVSFRQRGGDPVDILFYADYSPIDFSPLPQVLVSLLERSGNDFHLGVLGRDDDCLNLGHQHPECHRTDGTLFRNTLSPEPYLVPSTVNLVEHLADKLNRPTYGGFEYPVNLNSDHGPELAVWLALTPPLSEGANAGFRRPEARLSLVIWDLSPSLIFYITDPIPSPPPSVCPFAPYHYQCGWYPSGPRNAGEAVASLIELAGFPYLGKATISYSTPSPPEYPPGQIAWLFPLFHLIADAFDGAVSYAPYAPDDMEDNPLNFETYFRKVGEHLGESASGLRLRFPLPEVPDLSAGPITVLVDGAPVAPLDASDNRVWSYDAEENSVRFEIGTTPLPGSLVVVRFFAE